jgi:hypothetical protein
MSVVVTELDVSYIDAEVLIDLIPTAASGVSRAVVCTGKPAQCVGYYQSWVEPDRQRNHIETVFRGNCRGGVMLNVKRTLAKYLCSNITVPILQNIRFVRCD